MPADIGSDMMNRHCTWEPNRIRLNRHRVRHGTPSCHLGAFLETRQPTSGPTWRTTLDMWGPTWNRMGRHRVRHDPSQPPRVLQTHRPTSGPTWTPQSPLACGTRPGKRSADIGSDMTHPFFPTPWHLPENTSADIGPDMKPMLALGADVRAKSARHEPISAHVGGEESGGTEVSVFHAAHDLHRGGAGTGVG